MLRVDIISEAEQEILELLEADAEQGSRLVAVIEELTDSYDIDDLTEQGYYFEDFNVDCFWHMQNEHQRNVWRLKIFGIDNDGSDFTLNHRVIYAPDRLRNTVHVLGIMERNLDYENDKDFIEKIKIRYDRLGLPSLPK